MIYAMTVGILFIVLLLIALGALRLWATHDRFATHARPTLFD